MVALISAFLIHRFALHDSLTIAAIMGLIGMGCYVGGTYYSLAYLRKTTECERWTACTKPSVITVALLAVLGLLYNIHALPASNALDIGISGISVAASVAIFGWMTATAFRKFELEDGASRQLLTSDRVESPRLRMAVSRRLRGAGVGLLAGFVVGIGMAMTSITAASRRPAAGRRDCPGAWRLRASAPSSELFPARRPSDFAHRHNA